MNDQNMITFIMKFFFKWMKHFMKTNIKFLFYLWMKTFIMKIFKETIMKDSLNIKGNFPLLKIIYYNELFMKTIIMIH
jgi:hypothetical protein